MYQYKGVFRDIVAPERLVFTTCGFEDDEGNPQLEVLNTVTFTELGGKTKRTLHAVVGTSTPEVGAALAGMEEGWTQSLDRLPKTWRRPELDHDYYGEDNGQRSVERWHRHRV